MSWPTVKLGDVTFTTSGGTPKRDNDSYYGGSINWIKSGELSQDLITSSEEFITEEGLKNSSAKLMPPFTVLLAMYGATVGAVSILGIPATTNQAICCIQPFAELNCFYLKAYLKSIKQNLLASRVGGAQPNLNQDLIRNLKIPLPPLAQQKRIAAILDKADEIKRKREQAIAKLDQLAQSIFVEMFGDLANNSKGWDIGKIGDLLESATYGTSEKANSIGSYAVLRMNNITRSGAIDLKDLKYMYLEEKHLDRFLVKAGDVLFNRTNSADLVGKTAIYRMNTPVAYAGYLIRLRVNEMANGEYIAGFLNTKYAKKELRLMCKSIIGMANINAKEIQAMRIPITPIALQEQFATRISKLEKLKASNIAALAKHNQLFASLQNQAFTGQL